ncbi:hypothetical protein [Telluribacter sp.]|jgi:hypothetical protein|uniref:hypothetical protein n=1 Tax=Telluribacter sp. TaxID=1978767 RepID=UPI002E0EE990|nr:hypothetical protein [Telluribacter sp.]
MKKYYLVFLVLSACMSKPTSDPFEDSTSQSGLKPIGAAMAVVLTNGYAAKDRYQQVRWNSIQNQSGRTITADEADELGLVKVKAGNLVKVVSRGETNSVVSMTDNGHRSSLLYIKNSLIAW